MKHILQGQRVKIKLEEFSRPKSGLIELAYVDGVTDGGKPISQIDEFPLAPVGEVIDIAKGAQKVMEEMHMDYKVGDRVYVQPHSMHKNSYFYADPTKKVIYITDEEERHIYIHPTNILSIIED